MVLKSSQEHYEIGSEENKVHYNIWLPEDAFPGFREYYSKIFWELHTISMVFMDALLLGMDIGVEDAKVFKNLHSGHDSILRLFHYPPVDQDKVDEKILARCPAHQDLT